MFRPGMRRAIAGAVLVTFTSLTLQPLTAAAQLPSAPRAQAKSAAESADARFSRTLNEMHEILKELVPAAAMPKQRAALALPAGARAGKVATLRSKHQALKGLEAEVDAGFTATEQHLRKKNLPPEILARHHAALAEYQRRKAEFSGLMKSVEDAAEGRGDLESALNGLGQFMAKYPNAKTHTPSDPNNLPWGSPKPVTRKPYKTPAEFKTSRLFSDPVKVAQAGSLSGIGLPTTALPATPTPEDLAPTEDVQITQAIRDLATSLGNQPVAIHNWVRNNIQFIPSYGSIQGSDMTLQTKRGNAFDTASLLIALLRAANIPARYVYGTIEVPVEKVMNWVGGVSVPEAAMNLMGQGGIPNVGVAQGGQVKWIDLEHVWVEAYVDYVPSRGAVNRTPNTWVPLDASFKQYQFTQGMDVRTNVPFDAQSFITQIQQGATVNETEGWVQNVNQTLIQSTLTNYQAQVTNYVNAQKANATAGDVLGTQTIVQENRPILLGTLPYTKIATGAKFQAIPDGLRWKFRYNVYANDVDRANDSAFMSLNQSTPSLAGKKITLSFSPATQSDIDTISSFLPQPHPDGTPILPSELPSSLPGYLINLVPELRLDGQVVATGPAFTMGSELIQASATYNAGTGQWEQGDDNRPTAGEYIATALDLQGISAAQATELKNRLEATKAKLDQFQQNPGDPTPLQNLTKEDLTGNLMYAGVLNYFAAIDAAGTLSGRGANVVTERMPSFGNFGVVSKTLFSFGVPRNVSFPGLQMDIDRIAGAEFAMDANATTLVSFRKTIGDQYSAHEHLIPEMLFTDPTDPSRPQAISAVKAISFAAAQGQRIYTLNAENQAIHAQVLSSLSVDQSVRDELANALALGKAVTVHQASISTFGFTGVGYIIIDPATGAGAYKISGGSSGAVVFTLFLSGLLTILGLYFAPAAFALLTLFYSANVFIIATIIALRIGLIDCGTLVSVRQLALSLGLGAVPDVAIGRVIAAIVLNAIFAGLVCSQ